MQKPEPPVINIPTMIEEFHQLSVARDQHIEGVGRAVLVTLIALVQMAETDSPGVARVLADLLESHAKLPTREKDSSLVALSRDSTLVKLADQLRGMKPLEPRRA